jgi:hypothetical protein
MRFAGRVVRQQQFAALARQRSWEYTLQGAFHSHDGATLRLHGLDVVAELRMPHLEPYPMPESDVDRFVLVGGLTFADARGATVPLAALLPCTFTEVLRDVSLFAAVAAAAMSPAWADAPGSLRRAYERARFPPLSTAGEMRRDVLRRNLDLLDHADRLALDDRAQRVRGDLATYRIHLDTAEALIAPHGPPAALPSAVVHEAAAARLRFGDPVLAQVLAIAVRLAEDASIDDPVFRLQLESAPAR